MPPGDIWQCLVTLVFVPPEKEEVNTGISRVEANDAAKHPTMHRIAPPIMKYLTQNASSTKTEKPHLKGTGQAHLIPSPVPLTELSCEGQSLNCHL